MDDIKDITILVCGGRNFGLTKPERDFIYKSLNEFSEKHSSFFNPDDNWLPSDIIVISGAAKGVDTVAIDWAVVHWSRFKEFPADWDKYGKRAGILRNIQMLDEGKPDYVLAFPGGKGTAHMVASAKSRGIPVMEYVYVC